MKNVVIMNHPLIDHKMTLLRSKKTSHKEFRELLNEITKLMCYESMRNLKMEEVEVETPLEITKSKVIPEKQIVFVPILRAGLGMVDGAMNMLPTSSVGFLGFYRNPETLKPVQYYCKLPADIESKDVIVLDPMLATGGTAVDAVSLMKEKNPRSIKFMCIVASPQGLEALSNAHPDIEIYCAAKDRDLNKNGYILPGLGDAGDRIFGTI